MENHFAQTCLFKSLLLNWIRSSALLPLQAWKLYESDELMKLVDERLDPSEYQTEQVKRVMEIALMCTQSSVASRPSMSEIVVLLLSKGEAGLKPTRPTFIEATKRVQTDTSTSTASSASNATVSISQFSAR